MNINIMHVVYHEDGSFGLSSIDILMLMITKFTLWEIKEKSSSINVNKVIYVFEDVFLKKSLILHIVVAYLYSVKHKCFIILSYLYLICKF